MPRQKIKRVAEDYTQRFGNRLLWSVSTVGILGLTTPLTLAQDCDTDQDAIVYDSSDGLEPNFGTSDKIWQTLCDGAQGVDFASIVDGILIIDDDSTGSRASYCRSSIFLPNCDPRQDAVYEFSTKVVSVDTAPNSWVPKLAFICGMRDHDDDFRVGVTLDEGVGFFKTTNDVSNWLVIDGDDQRVAVDWTDEHLFRIEKDDTEVRLFMDNEDTPSVTVALEDLFLNLRGNAANLAVTSTPGEAKFEMMMFRYRIGTTVFDEPDPDCAADFDDNGTVGASDLLTLLAAWGPCVDCDEDLDGDDVVGASDLLILLATWGPCP
ncbi:MAG: hypothetical protein V3T53_16230 [Phycisphaerales bacterium]